MEQTVAGVGRVLKQQIPEKEGRRGTGKGSEFHLTIILIDWNEMEDVGMESTRLDSHNQTTITPSHHTTLVLVGCCYCCLI